MTCRYHRDLCAYPDWDESRCERCHASWWKITAPATRETTRESFMVVVSNDLVTGKRKRTTTDTPTVVTDVAYLNGYGEMPLNHLWRHAVDEMRGEAKNDRRKALVSL